MLNRITDIRGTYSLRGAQVSLSNLQINTSLTNITANGMIDLESKALNLTSRLVTGTISDLTFPYYRGAEGRGDFSGEIGGSCDDPRVSGKITLTNCTIEEYRTDSFIADFSYQKNLLNLRDSVFRSQEEEHRVKGKISFPQAKELFDLAMPVYDMSVTLRNADFERAVRIFSKDFAGTGTLNCLESEPEPFKPVQPAPAAVGPTDGIGAMATRVWDEIKQMIRIRRLEHPELPLLSPSQAYFLRQNLVLRLLSARVALLQRDEATFRSDVLAARQWLEQYFIQQDPVAQSMRESLQALEKTPVALKDADIGESIKALRAWRGGKE